MDQNERLWHKESVSGCFSALNTTERGLSMTEVVKRLRQYGENSLPAPKTLSLFRIFIRQFESPLIYILLIASAVVFFLGETTDTVVILSVLLINALIGLFQEGKAQNTFLAIENFTKTEAVVIREGLEEVVIDTEVVPGDILVLRDGAKVAADARLFEVKNFRVDESALTGESLPVSKVTDRILTDTTNPSDRLNMVFRGTLVVSGTAYAVVVATGSHTVIGEISRKIISIDTEIPLKKNIRILSNFIGVGVLVISAGVFGLGLLYGNQPSEMFFTAVAVAVSLVPEGLPVVITLVLSLGAYRMAKKNALVKNLGAVEALGQVSVIAVDKTGTITKNELMVEKVYVDGTFYSVSGNGYESKGDIMCDGTAIDPANHPEILFAGKVAMFCADARVTFREKEGTWMISGDPTEAALLVFGEKVGFLKNELEQEEPQTNDLPFDTMRKYHATLHTIKKKSFLSLVGAPETVVATAHHIRVHGRSRKLTEEMRQELETAIHAMSREGLRVLAFAYVSDYEDELDVAPIQGTTFGGFFAMRDMLREGVAESIKITTDSGVRVVMITGDHKVTAETIAREAGIFKDGDLVLTGKDLATLSKEEIIRQLPKVSVFARVSPENKLEIIELFRNNGDIVAMTGDGVNDALSLVAADLGIAMGKTGTEVSKEAADIVLLDDNFKSIVSAIEEGRGMYQGIKRVILYLFSTGLGELFAIVGALLLFLPLPVFPTQILWLNLITDGFLVVALAFEPKQHVLGHRMQTIKKRVSSFFFDKLTLVRTLLMGTTMAVVTLLIFNFFISTDAPKAYTMSLTVLAALQWWNAWNVRSENESLWSTNWTTKIFANPYLVIATLTVVILQFFAIYSPVMNKLLGTTALSFSEVMVAVVASLAIVLVEELRKFVFRTWYATHV